MVAVAHPSQSTPAAQVPRSGGVPVNPEDKGIFLPHEACELMPPMTEAEFQALKADIAERGQLDKIVIHDGAILDGRHRYRACIELDIEPKFRHWSGEGGSPTQYVLSTNLKRRSLNDSQRAMVAARALPLLEAEAKERQRKAAEATNAARKSHGDGPRRSGQYCPERPPAKPPQRARDVAAESANVSPRQVQDAKRLDKDAPDLADEVRLGTKSVGEATSELRKREKARDEKLRAEAGPPAPKPPTVHLGRIKSLLEKVGKDVEETRSRAPALAVTLDRIAWCISEAVGAVEAAQKVAPAEVA